MVYLHILGEGDTSAAKANNKGHLFETLMEVLLKKLKLEVQEKNKHQYGLEIDLEGYILLGEIPFIAECKAQSDSLNSPQLQQFGYKFYQRHAENNEVRGYLFSLSELNSSANQIWDQLTRTNPKKLKAYFEQDIIDFLIEEFNLPNAETICNYAIEKFKRKCGDTQLLCVADNNNQPVLYWAQLLMSADGTEPSHVVLFNSLGELVTERKTIDSLLSLKSDLKTLDCLNYNGSSIPSSRLDDLSTGRTVVRVRMSSDWFDYRFPAAPQFFVGRYEQRNELSRLIGEIRQNKTSTRGFTISGKSGFGKSSLALKARDELRDQQVIFLPIDSRLCEDITFLFDSVNELIYEIHQIETLKADIGNITIRGLDSLLNTLEEINNILSEKGYLAVLFFDQFERVFEYPEIAKALRNLFLNITEKQLSILFGFAWKSDLWSLAEGFPHQERADIVKESHLLKTLSNFDEQETSEILKQLEIQWSDKLSDLLKKQLRIFSRGLPWLLKKVCAHVLEQKEFGVDQDELIESNLNLQDLFESDLEGLDDEERALLRAIAPHLPATLGRLSESFEISNIDQSLHRFIDKRILVKITEDAPNSLADVKYDTYSDIFREFLITGIVPIQDAYYFFGYPKGALRFFEKVRERGSVSIEEESEETGKIAASIYNSSRDLRSLGLIDVRNKVFSVSNEAANLEEYELVAYLQTRMKKNRAVSLILSEINENDYITLERIAILLQELFPSVEAKSTTWKHYSRTMSSWFHEARLAFYRNNEGILYKVEDEEVFERIVNRGSLQTTGFRFPMCFRNAILECIDILYIHRTYAKRRNAAKMRA